MSSRKRKQDEEELVALPSDESEEEEEYVSPWTQFIKHRPVQACPSSDGGAETDFVASHAPASIANSTPVRVAPIYCSGFGLPTEKLKQLTGSVRIALGE